MFFPFRKTPSKPSHISLFHDPSAVPAAPIFPPSAVAVKKNRRVHWWDCETVRVTSDNIFSLRGRLPSCGFFTPSASFASLSDHDLAWVPAIVYQSFSDISEVQFLFADGGKEVRPSTGRPLERVLTITGRVGDAIRKRRSVEKGITRKDLMRGIL